MKPECQEAFCRLWARVPAHVREVNFGLGHDAWTAKDIDSLADVLVEHADRFSAHKTDLGHCTALPFRIDLKPGTRPVKQRPYRRSPVINRKIKIEIDRLVSVGILRKSTSNWASPLVAVLKKDGSLRLTCNFKRLNEATIVPVFPMPLVSDLISALGGSKVFSVLDLMSGYFQAAIDESSIPLTAVCTSFGLFEWTRTPQGCSGSPANFQSLMAKVCDGLRKIQVYLDDVIVPSLTAAEHVVQLRELLVRFKEFDLKLSPKKAHIGSAEVTFLGHLITPFGLHPDPKKTDAMAKMKMPKTKSELRSMLGSVSYLRKFLPNLARNITDLTALLKKDVHFKFTAHHEQLTKAVLAQLASYEVLAFPDYDAAIDGTRKFRLTTDASISGFGAVLEQPQEDGTVRPLVYISRSTLPNEANWDVSSLECGALVWAIRKLRVYLYGIPFEAFTDHQPLLSFISMGEKKPRVQRMCDFLSAYSFTLSYRKGKENQVADALSRLPQPPTAADFDKCKLIEDGDLEVYFLGSRRRATRKLGSDSNAFISDPTENRFLRPVTLCTTEEVKAREWAGVQSELTRISLHRPSPSVLAINPSPSRPPHCPHSPVSSVGLQPFSGQYQPGLILHGHPIGATATERDVAGLLVDVGVVTRSSRPSTRSTTAAAARRPRRARDVGVEESPTPGRVATAHGDAALAPAGGQPSRPQGTPAARTPAARGRGAHPSAVGPAAAAVRTARQHEDDSAANPTTTQPGQRRTAAAAAREARRHPNDPAAAAPTAPPPPSCGRRSPSPRRSRSRTPRRRAPRAGTIPVPESQAAAASRYGEKFNHKTDLEWAAAQADDPLAATVIKRAHRWPMVSLPLPSRPGEMVAFDILGPLPKSKRGNVYILLVVDLFSRHVEPYALTSEEKTAQGCATKLADDCVVRWGCPKYLLSDRGAEFTARVAKDVYRMLGAKKRGWQSTKQDQLDYLQLTKDRQARAYQLVVESDRLTKEKHRANNEQLDNAITKRPNFSAGE
ncbi:unnamed protein product [Ectocarpus sp. CCAP 1310/34]|nr:unnamed protein product [Ectocarpus sp. CCAP 1310/34]